MGYKVSGKRSGPPPLRGPNPQGINAPLKVIKAYTGKAVKQPTETKKEFEMRHAYHKPFMKMPKG